MNMTFLGQVDVNAKNFQDLCSLLCSGIEFLIPMKETLHAQYSIKEDAINYACSLREESFINK